MDESRRDPREDIILIRQILQRATNGMKTVSPWFTGFGLVWLIYGLFSAVQRLVMLQVPLSAAERLAFAGGVAGWLFYLILAGGFLVCRGRQKHRGLDTLAQKLMDLWGVCIFTFLLLTILMSTGIPLLANRGLGFSMESYSSLGRACFLCRSLLFFLLPVTPLLITAVFLENRRMLWAGIALAVLAAVVLSCHALMVFGDGTAVRGEWRFFWTGAVCMLDLVPGAMLLVFGRQLKRA